MKYVSLILALAGCPDKPKQQKLPIPANAKVLVSKECSLWPHPPRTDWYQDVTTYDLEAATFETVHREGDEEVQPPKAPEKKTGAIDAARVQLLRTRLAAVVNGGPWQAKHPMSGGGGCTLVLHGGDFEKPYVEIDRAEPNGNDAVDQLLAAM